MLTKTETEPVAKPVVLNVDCCKASKAQNFQQPFKIITFIRLSLWEM